MAQKIGILFGKIVLVLCLTIAWFWLQEEFSDLSISSGMTSLDYIIVKFVPFFLLGVTLNLNRNAIRSITLTKILISLIVVILFSQLYRLSAFAHEFVYRSYLLELLGVFIGDYLVRPSDIKRWR